MGLIDGGLRSASAVVEQPVVAWRLSIERYQDLRDTGSPAVGWILGELGRRLSQRVRAVESRIGRARSQPALASMLPIEPSRSRRWYQWLWPWS
jgi:CRP-like cAMP-binding protein